MTSIEDYQTTAIFEALREIETSGPGDCVEHARVMEWLNSWGTDEEVEPPVCEIRNSLSEVSS